MWRFWNSFPRFVRQQFHGPRASAGVCVEEEKAEHDVEKYINETGPDGWDHKRRASQELCLQARQEQEPQSDRKDGAHHEHNDWWKHHCHGNFWCNLFCQHRTLEAVTWGAAVVLGLKLSRQQKCPSFRELLKDRDKRQQWRGLLFRVAFAMPPDLGLAVSRSVLDRPVAVKPSVKQAPVRSSDTKASDKQRRKGSALLTDDKKSLTEVMQEFESSCRQYAAVGSSVSGVCAAEQGQLDSAVKELQLACELGHAPACFNLALCYQEGLGVEANSKQAASYYQVAAQDGHAQSIFNLALMTLKGEGGLVKDKVKALQLLKQAAHHGLAQAQTYLGVYYTENEDDQQDFEQAASFFKAAACQNDVEGQYFLGICYENGWGVEGSDEEAARLYAAAAELGHDGAMYNLAAFHEYGLGGVNHDEQEAMNLYERSAKCGNESARFRLQEVAAREAVREWSEQKDSINSKIDILSPGLRRTLCFSSPAFTDYIRQNMAVIWNGELSASSSRQTLAAPHQSTDMQDRVTFTLGGDDVPQDQVGGYSMLAVERGARIPVGSASGLHRTYTMPELQMVPCQ